MKTGLYPRLALDGIRKNRKLYVPFGLTCIAMIMMTYIIGYLKVSPALTGSLGIDTIRMILTLGQWVMIIFSCIFLFYTNSFLVRRRKKEFGLYNVLGMGKGNIGVIMFWETLIVLAASLIIGIAAGIAFSKLAELLLLNIVHSTVDYKLTVSVQSLIWTAALFAAIFILLYLNTLRQVRFSTAISLVRSEAVGEKAPKANWFLGLLGFLILAAAYVIAVRIKNPVSAISLFFVAVIMVIVATYLLMIAGSVLFCRLLQKNRKYYYKSNHFISVSSMVYRMKRNGAGLASICILATMVLVMISTTTCLYAGCSEVLNTRYPGQINYTVYYPDFSQSTAADMETVRETTLEKAATYGTSVSAVNDYCRISVAGLLNGDTLNADPYSTDFDLGTFTDVVNIIFLSLSDYNVQTGVHETLAPDEAMLYSPKYSYTADTIGFEGGSRFTITRRLDGIFCTDDSMENILPALFLVVPDLDAAVRELESQVDFDGSKTWIYQFDTTLEPEQVDGLYENLRSAFTGINSNGRHIILENRYDNIDDMYGLYGGLFFLGIILSLVFILAAVLIIYYKQISEGYEDQSRFSIMQKVGMTSGEIRRSINSQLLTVFFLPLLGAGLHLAFAFPMIRKILLLFNLNNVWLFALTTVISFLLFSLFYVLVYRITSNEYFHIVSGTKQKNV